MENADSWDELTIKLSINLAGARLKNADDIDRTYDERVSFAFVINPPVFPLISKIRELDLLL